MFAFRGRQIGLHGPDLFDGALVLRTFPGFVVFSNRERILCLRTGNCYHSPCNPLIVLGMNKGRRVGMGADNLEFIGDFDSVIPRFESWRPSQRSRDALMTGGSGEERVRCLT